jgi:DNA helicase-2/ATP-dependent DNA helicase PcrA
VLKWFHAAMRRNESAFTQLQYARRLELGQQVLSEYYDRYIHEFAKMVVAEFNIANVAVNGVPIKGKIDKIEFDGMDCVVIDYKTGSPEYSSRTQLMGPTESNPDGGDYWRQMVFYKILLDNAPAARGWRMTAGVFDFIEKNKKGDFVRYFVPIDAASVQTVKQQIKTVYNRIMNKEFDTGCGKEDCTWCNFVRTYELAKPRVDAELL